MGRRLLVTCPDCSAGYRYEDRVIIYKGDDGKTYRTTEKVPVPCQTCDSSGQILGPPT